MSGDTPDGIRSDGIRETVDAVYREESRRVLATLIRLLGDFDLVHCFLTGAPTMAQRIVRAKSKIRKARIPYQVPSPEELPGRVDAVLRVVYLVFNEGYSASSGAPLTRNDLSAEAIRLCRLIVALLPEPEAMGLLALMLLHESPRAWPSSTPSWRAVIWRTITWPIPRGRTCAGSWGARRTPAPHTSGR